MGTFELAASIHISQHASLLAASAPQNLQILTNMLLSWEESIFYCKGTPLQFHLQMGTVEFVGLYVCIYNLEAYEAALLSLAEVLRAFISVLIAVLCVMWGKVPWAGVTQTSAVFWWWCETFHRVNSVCRQSELLLWLNRLAAQMFESREKKDASELRGCARVPDHVVGVVPHDEAYWCSVRWGSSELVSLPLCSEIAALSSACRLWDA